MNASFMIVRFVQLFFSSVVVFFSLALLIELCFFVFRIKNPRTRAMCRLLPIFKLPFDLLLYKFSLQNLFVNFNPFTCHNYLEQFVLDMIPAHLTLQLPTMSGPVLPEIIATQIPLHWMQALIFGFLVISLGLIGHKAYQFFTCVFYLKRTCASAVPCHRLIVNPGLKKNLQRSKTTILVSHEVNIPFAAYGRTILFPKALLHQLSQEEFEAVIAHELEHVRWRDPFLKLVCTTVCSVFWWIPTHFWLKKMDEEHEKACDASVDTYQLDNHALATAIVKVIKTAKNSKDPEPALCYFATHESIPSKRLHLILERRNRAQRPHLIREYVLCPSLGTLTLLCFWIC